MELLNAIKNNALELSEQPAIIDHEKIVTWQEAYTLVDNIALGLVHNGMRRGKAVAMLTGHSRHEALSILAVIRGGGVAMPVARGHGSRAILDMVRRSGAQIIIYDNSKADIANWLRANHEFRTAIRIGGETQEGEIAWDKLENTLSEGARFPVLDNNSIVLHNFGLDSTGRLRAGLGTLGSIWEASGVQTRGLKLRPCTRLMTLFPSGVNSHEITVRAVRLGGTVLYSHGLHPRDVFKSIKQYGPDSITAPAWYYSIMADWIKNQNENLADVRTLEARGRLPYHLAKEATTTLGQELLQTWDTVETLGAALGATPSGYGAPAEPMRAFTGFDEKIIDHSGNSIENEKPGELLIYGTPVCKKTLAADGLEELCLDPDGWLHSGFLAQKMQDGEIRILGTRYDVILKGKDRVYPRIAADKVERMENVLEAEGVIIPEQPPEFSIIIAIVPRPGSNLDSVEAMEYIAHHIHPTQMPDDAVIVERIPKHPCGNTDVDALKKIILKSMQ